MNPFRKIASYLYNLCFAWTPTILVTRVRNTSMVTPITMYEGVRTWRCVIRVPADCQINHCIIDSGCALTVKELRFRGTLLEDYDFDIDQIAEFLRVYGPIDACIGDELVMFGHFVGEPRVTGEYVILFGTRTVREPLFAWLRG